MAYVMTYNSLQEDIRSYLERSGPNDPQVYAQLPHIIAMSEKNLIDEFELQGFQRYVTSVMSPGIFVYEKPDLWRETFNINIGTNRTSSATGFNTRVNLFPRGK